MIYDAGMTSEDHPAGGRPLGGDFATPDDPRMATPGQDDDAGAGLDRLRTDDLRRAVDIYMPMAYPDGPLPESVRRRLAWMTAGDAPEASALLARPPFERAAPGRDGTGPIYALRLGNVSYPHMKLQVQGWPHAVGYMLSVNTHDQIAAIDPNSPDAEGFRALQAANQHVKEAIEQAWDRAGLPTFLRYLRDYIEANPGNAAP